MSEEEAAQLKGKRARFSQMQKVWAGQGPMQKLGDLMVMLGTDSLCHPSILSCCHPEPSAWLSQRLSAAVGLSSAFARLLSASAQSKL